MKYVKKLREKLYELKKLEGIEFVHGCGNRNSYSKTDIDAAYESERTIYICEYCSNCSYKGKCIKGNNFKKL